MERLASMSDRTNKSIGVIGLGIIGRAVAALVFLMAFDIGRNADIPAGGRVEKTVGTRK